MVPAPGVGQVGQGLQNTWGMEEDDEEEIDSTGEEQEETVTERKDERRGGKYFKILISY